MFNPGFFFPSFRCPLHFPLCNVLPSPLRFFIYRFFLLLLTTQFFLFLPSFAPLLATLRSLTVTASFCYFSSNALFIFSRNLTPSLVLLVFSFSFLLSCSLICSGLLFSVFLLAPSGAPPCLLLSPLSIAPPLLLSALYTSLYMLPTLFHPPLFFFFFLIRSLSRPYCLRFFSQLFLLYSPHPPLPPLTFLPPF